jgi:ubiquitin-activating enzyme E1
VTGQGEERLPMKMSALVEHVGKKPIPPHVKQLLVEVMVSDVNDEDVDVSTTLYHSLVSY